MVIKKIVIEFANRNIDAVDYISDISDAVTSVEKYLLTWRQISVMGLYKVRNKVVLEIAIPGEISESFTPGRHLRGISKYLLSKKGSFYKPFLVGTRLLHYREYVAREGSN